MSAIPTTFCTPNYFTSQKLVLWYSGLNRCLGCPHPIWACLVESLLTHLASSEWELKDLSSCHPCRRPIWSSWLLASRRMNQRTKGLCRPSPYKQTFQTNSNSYLGDFSYSFVYYSKQILNSEQIRASPDSRKQSYQQKIALAKSRWRCGSQHNLTGWLKVWLEKQQKNRHENSKFSLLNSPLSHLWETATSSASQ